MSKAELYDTLIDKEAIACRLSQYCRAVDARDTALLKDVYWPEATDDHGFFVGNAHEFATYNTENTPLAFHSTWHSVSDIVVDLDANFANVESRLLAYHRVKADPMWIVSLLGEEYAAKHADSPNGHDYLVGGGYSDRFEKRGDVWRIIYRRAYTSWQIAGPPALTGAEGIFGATSCR